MLKRRPVVGVIGLSGQSVFMEVDHFHAPGETLTAHSIGMEPGGKGFNQAVAARRLGAEVRFLTMLGDDEFGRQCESRLVREEVSTRIVRSGFPTAFASILTDAAGDNRVTVYPGRAEGMTGDSVEANSGWLSGCDALLIQLEYPWHCAEAVLRLAARRGIPAILNPAPAHRIPLEQLRRFDAILPNLQEAGALLGVEAKSMALAPLAAALRRAELPRAVVTLGGGGALEMDEASAFHWACPHAKVVDTTGAGDTFCAAYAVKTAEGATRSAAVAFALKAASRSVEHARVLDGLPYCRQIMEPDQYARVRIELGNP